MKNLYNPRGERGQLIEKWYSEGYYSNKTLADILSIGCDKFGLRRTVYWSENGTKAYTAKDLYTQSHALAGSLFQIGIRAGDVIAIQVPNWVEGRLIFQASLLLGAIVLPIIHIYGASEVAYILKKSGAKLLVIPDQWKKTNYLDRLDALGEIPSLKQVLIIGENIPKGCLSWLDFVQLGNSNFPSPNSSSDDVALIVFTSGTTSEPKGVLHSHNSLISELTLNVPSSITGHAIVLTPWPAGHIAGVLDTLQLYMSGAEVIQMDSWNAKEAARLAEKFGVNFSSGTPYFLTSMLDAAEEHKYDLSKLQTYRVGASNVPKDLVLRCERRGIITYRAYGLSEHPSISAGKREYMLDKRSNTDGHVEDGCTVRIVDDFGKSVPLGEEGEIVSIGPDQFLGYQQPEFNIDAFYPGGWFKTGDIGRLDSEGFLTITDRKKDIIIRGGENIASKEVEDLLSAHPSVLEVSVTAMPDKRLGEVVCAFVILKEGTSLSIEDVREYFVSLNVAKQKTPERIIISTDLPRTASGKVKKFELRDRLRTEFKKDQGSI